MKVYIEAIEQTDAETADFIREEVTKTDADAIKLVLEQIDAEKTYKLRRHVCRHDEEPIKPCHAETVTEEDIAAAIG